jgi:hypothetical protein
MKIVVCYSGLYRQFSGWEKNHEIITNFADNVIYSTWDGYEIPKDSSIRNNVVLFKEPIITYNPFHIPEFILQYPTIAKAHKNNPGWNKLTKQILAHQMVSDFILPTNYDITIRMRYDSWIGQTHNWKKIINQVYETQQVISFGGWSGEMDKIPNICNSIIPANNISKLNNALCDFMNIHPSYKMNGTMKLHKTEKLFPSNQGWYQVLSSPYKDGHINYGGGVMLTRYRT